mgnify:FL=1
MTETQEQLPRLLDTIQSMSKLMGADRDKRTSKVIIALIDSGVSAESIADVVLEFKASAMRENNIQGVLKR